MINLVMYSDQVIPENDKVDARLLDLLGGKRNRLGYVPSGPEPDFRFFSEKQAYYARLGLELDLFFDLDQEVDQGRLDALLSCDAIHLSGGDTQSFLARLIACDMLGHLRKWAVDGGLLVGTSAGAILMTPTIAVDAMFNGARPEDLRDGEALNLVPFEFFPHLDAKPDYLSRLLSYSKTTSRRIAACRDGDGVVIDQGNIENLGRIVWISDGVVVEPPNEV